MTINFIPAFFVIGFIVIVVFSIVRSIIFEINVPILEYSRWEKFEPVIKKAILSCENSGQCSEDHFHRTVKMAHIGIGKQIETIDYHISRYGRIKSFFSKNNQIG